MYTHRHYYAPEPTGRFYRAIKWVASTAALIALVALILAATFTAVTALVLAVV